MNGMESFPIEVILSVSHQKLLCEIGEVYRLCNYLSGDNLFTHQLPRACDILRPWIFEHHPILREWSDSEISPANYRQYVDRARALFGKELALPPLPRERWTHIDPVEEARAMVGDDKVIVVGDKT